MGLLERIFKLAVIGVLLALAAHFIIGWLNGIDVNGKLVYVSAFKNIVLYRILQKQTYHCNWCIKRDW